VPGNVTTPGSPETDLPAGAGMLELCGLTRRFSALTALDDLSFSVPSGKVVGFLGPNGAGKTTTMRAIFGLVDLDAGAVRWNAAPVARHSGAASATCPRSVVCIRGCWSKSSSSTWAGYTE
jgi:ABC-type multidrug transport system ATPase subunit